MAKRLFRFMAYGPAFGNIDGAHPVGDARDMGRVRGLDGPCCHVTT